MGLGFRVEGCVLYTKFVLRVLMGAACYKGGICQGILVRVVIKTFPSGPWGFSITFLGFRFKVSCLQFSLGVGVIDDTTPFLQVLWAQG